MNHEPDNSRKSQASRPVLEGLDLQRLMTEAIHPDPAREDSGEFPALEGYEFLRPLGQGGMGQVFLARQVSLDRLVAVKLIGGQDPVATQFFDRLEREAQTMARVSHPNLVQVFDFLRLEDGNAAIVMEWISGGNLRETKLFEGAPPLSVEKTLDLIEPILDGLDAAHRAGIVHRDVKPENLLISPDGTIKMTDFGLSIPTEEENRLTVTGTYVGTPGYMAPEQLEGGQPDARTDLYAVGVLLYEMLTGKTPVGHFDPPRTLNSKIPREVNDAILSCLRTDPENRPSDAKALLRQLHGKSGKPARRRILAGGLATAGVGIGAYLLLRPDDLQDEAVKSSPEESPLPGSGPESPSGNNVPAASPVSDHRALSGEWHRDGESFESNDEVAFCAIAPGRPLMNSNIRFSFTRISGEYSVGIFFRLPMGVGSCELSAWEADLGGVQTIDGKDLRELPDAFQMVVVNGRRYSVELQIRPDKTTTLIDGEKMQEQAIADRGLGTAFPWNWDSLETTGVDLALASYQSPTIFHSVTVEGG